MNNPHLTFLFALALLTSCAERPLPQFGDPISVIVPIEKSAYGPRLTQHIRNGAILSWMERNDEGGSLLFSSFHDGEWQSPLIAALDDQMFINWADLPAVATINANALLAHWRSHVSNAPYAYQILTSISNDQGVSWSAPESPHSDGTPTEHGFVSTFATGADMGLIWLDGRNTPDNGMTLRSAIIDSDGRPQKETLIDDLVCDCCQTDVAITRDGPIATYRDRTSEEVRDIYVSRFIDGFWQSSIPISNDNWVISGCPVNGPSISAVDEQVAISWFTAANEKPMVKMVLSSDAGKSFSEPIIVDAEGTLGNVSIVSIDQLSFVVTWMKKLQNKSYAIQIRVITTDGKIGAIKTIGQTTNARTVPQILKIDDNLLIAWTDDRMGTSKIKSVKVKILRDKANAT